MTGVTYNPIKNNIVDHTVIDSLCLEPHEILMRCKMARCVSNDYPLEPHTEQYVSSPYVINCHHLELILNNMVI